MEEIIREEYENAEIICGGCIGEMNLVQVQKTTPKLFTLTFFQNLTLHCNLCNKTTKEFKRKLQQTK